MYGTELVALGALFASAVNLFQIKKLKQEVARLKAAAASEGDHKGPPVGDS